VTRGGFWNAGKKGKNRMGEDATTGSTTEFLARIQRFTDGLLDGLDKASRGKDVDEKEVRMLRFAIQKSLRIWYKTLRDGKHDPRLVEKLREVEKKASEVKTGET
jgi:hypothetical protein